jgi:hypothetical protein
MKRQMSRPLIVITYSLLAALAPDLLEEAFLLQFGDNTAVDEILWTRGAGFRITGR